MYIGQKLPGANHASENRWAETLEQVKKEEAEQGYNDDETSEEEQEEEDLYDQPLEIDVELIKQKAAEMLGVHISELPVAKAATSAAKLTSVMRKSPRMSPKKSHINNSSIEVVPS